LIAQHECLTFTGSNAAIVYAGAEDPFAVNAPPPITSAAPACWTSLSGILPAPAGIPRSANPANDGPVHRLLSPAPAYLHERSASNGERLVVAQLGEQALAGKIHRVICCRVFAPMGLRRDPVLLWEESTIVASSFDTGSMLRVSFGRTDGGDPSGFTIPIELGGAHKLLHGRLNPDDTITTEIKEAGIP
jgi:hypothetical protein